MPGQETVIEPVVNKDPFTGELSLSMKIVSCEAYSFAKVSQFCITTMIDSSVYVMGFNPCAYKNVFGETDGCIYVYTEDFDVDLRLLIKFDDDTILIKELTALSSNHFRLDLTESDCENFLSKRITIIRAEDENSMIDFPLIGDSIIYKGLDEVFQILIERFLEAAAKDIGWFPSHDNNKLINTVADTKNENYEDDADYCCVYLMNDTANGYYKIGMSNNPEYRESTLQSEKPSIVKICHKQYPSRRMARSIEAALHRMYGSKRIRGEWFSLNEKDIWEIKQVLS